MDNILKSYEMEHMRMAMLKQEQTFKHQVHELHRLYWIQKKLMSDIEGNRPNQQRQHGVGIKQIDCGQQAQDNSILKVDLEHIPSGGSPLQSNDDHKLMDESEIELTLGPAIYKRMNYKKPDTSPISDSGPSFSSISFTRKSANKGTAEAGGCKLRPARVPEMSMDYISQRKTSINAEEQLRQERVEQPSWLLQVSSLKMTRT